MKVDVTCYVKHHKHCQLNKLSKRNYSKLQPKDDVTAMKPQNRVCVDAISSWDATILKFTKGKNGKTKKIRTKVTTIYALAAIDEATSQPEIIRISNEICYETQHTLNRNWLCRYPHPKAIVYDNGSEFASEFQNYLPLMQSKALPSPLKTRV